MKTINVYTYSELPDDVKEKVLDEYSRHFRVGPQEWWKDTEAYLKKVMKALGFTIDGVVFYEFNDEVDAFFKVSYQYEHGWCEKLNEIAGGMRFASVGDHLERLQENLECRYNYKAKFTSRSVHSVDIDLKATVGKRYDETGEESCIIASDHLNCVFIKAYKRLLVDEIRPWLQIEGEHNVTNGALERLKKNDIYFFKDGRISVAQSFTSKFMP